jgi:hypothetical protein
LAFSATTTSAGTGNWSASGTWSAGVPDVNDQVLIQGGHTVTLDASGTCADLHVAGGVLAFTGGNTLTIKDAAGTHATGEHIRIADDSGTGWNSNGTAAAPVVIQSANTGQPSYRIKLLLEDVTTAETRTMDWSYMDIRDAACFLGNDTRYVWFNTGDITNDGVIDQPLPVIREQQMDGHYIEGRSYGRVYRDGGHAGTIGLSGLVPWASFDWQTLSDMRDNGDKVAFQGQYVTMYSGRIEALQFGRRAGPYVPFTLTLIEDL